MNHTLTMILYILAFVCFVLAAFGFSVRKTNLIALGLACWILPLVVTSIQGR